MGWVGLTSRDQDTMEDSGTVQEVTMLQGATLEDMVEGTTTAWEQDPTLPPGWMVHPSFTSLRSPSGTSTPRSSAVKQLAGQVGPEVLARAVEGLEQEGWRREEHLPEGWRQRPVDASHHYYLTPTFHLLRSVKTAVAYMKMKAYKEEEIERFWQEASLYRVGGKRREEEQRQRHTFTLDTSVAVQEKKEKKKICVDVDSLLHNYRMVGRKSPNIPEDEMKELKERENRVMEEHERKTTDGEVEDTSRVDEKLMIDNEEDAHDSLTGKDDEGIPKIAEDMMNADNSESDEEDTSDNLTEPEDNATLVKEPEVNSDTDDNLTEPEDSIVQFEEEQTNGKVANLQDETIANKNKELVTQVGPKRIKRRKVSSGGGNVKCKDCDWEGGTENGLRYHKRTVHEGLKNGNYTCTKCDFKSTSNFYMKRHKAEKHSAEVKPSEEQNSPHAKGGLKGAGRSKVRNLKEAVHEGAMYDCSSCDYRSSRATNLEEHKLKYHSDEQLQETPEEVDDVETNDEEAVEEETAVESDPEEGGLPPLWREEGGGLVFAPPGVAGRRFAGRAPALLWLVGSGGARPEHVYRLWAGLAREGWATEPLLPPGWRRRGWTFLSPLMQEVQGSQALLQVFLQGEYSGEETARVMELLELEEGEQVEGEQVEGGQVEGEGEEEE